MTTNGLLTMLILTFITGILTGFIALWWALHFYLIIYPNNTFN